MTREVIDVNNGVVTELYYNSHDSKFVKNRYQDVSGIIEQNKQAILNSEINKKDNMYLKAEVPVTVIEQWSKELGDNCMKKKYRDFLHKKLNDPDNKMWLTAEGKMGKRISWR